MKLLLGLILAAAVGLSAGAAAARDMTFRMASNGRSCAECQWIAADGAITDDTPTRLAKFLKGKPARGMTLRINSGGGDVASSILLGRLIRERGLNTAVSKTQFAPGAPKARPIAAWTKGMCASACAYTFLGGVERTLDDGSRLGVHQFYSDALHGRGSFAVAQSQINDLGVYMADMGVNGNLILTATATDPLSMHWLTRTELESFHAVTDVRSPQEAEWAFGQAQDGLYLVSRQTQTNGSVTEFQVTCSAEKPGVVHLLASQPLATAPAEKYADIGKSVRGGKLHAAVSGAADLRLAKVEVNQDRLQVAGDMDRTAFARMIAPDSAELYIDLDVPSDYAGYVGGISHRFPVKNLGKAMPVLLRNCA